MTADSGGQHDVLVGRADEQATLLDVLGRLGSRSAAVVVHGEVGSGKSALLRWLVATAAARDVAVVEATGVEFERELAFGGLAAALRPLLPHLDGLGAVPRRALEVAMGRELGDAPTLTTYGAALALLSLAADQRPVLVVVDDAHWLDRASLAALLFAAHRAGVDRVGFVFAQRAGVGCLLDDTHLDRLELGGLGRDAAVELLARNDDVAVAPLAPVAPVVPLAPAVADRCWELTGGNPLALIEGARGLTPAQRTGAEPVPAALPVSDHLLGTFRARLADLPPATADALALLALDAPGDPAIVAAALEGAGRSVADLHPAEAQRLVTLDSGRWRWHHPLLRSAAHQGADGPWRRQAHRALADALTAAGHPDRALWHMAETIVGPDDDLAARLDELGAAAQRRGAHAAAATAHERAARLSTDPGAADERLLAAGWARWAAGDFVGTLQLLADRIPAAVRPATRTQMVLLVGQAEIWVHDFAPTLDRLDAQATAFADEGDPASAAALLLQVAIGRMSTLDPRAAVASAERAVALAEAAGDPVAQAAAAIARTLCRSFAGAGPEVTADLVPLGRFFAATMRSDLEHQLVPLAQVCGHQLLACEHWAEAVEIFRLAARSGDATGTIGRSALCRRFSADILWRTGRWAESLAEASQALSLLDSIRPGHIRPSTLALLARIEAGLGHEAACRAHAAEALATPPRADIHDLAAHSAVGLLELGLGRPAEAATVFDLVAARAVEVPEPGWLWWQGDAVDAYLDAGRVSDAERLLDTLAAQVEATGRGWARAVVARGRGRLAGSDDLLTSSIAGFRTVGAPFEEARSLLARGELRLAAGRSDEGAADVAAARSGFDRLGAVAWSSRTSAVTGDTPSPGDALTSLLTPAELRVALAVGHGASNRGAAEQLFISAKTVDHHLQSIYRKLNLRSRTQLVALVLKAR